jgi:ABC-type transport system involved in multi-copper enzyme maturation permease subunit
MQIALIASNTFRESVRDRVLYNLIIFALLMTVSSIFIGELAIGSERKIIVDLGLSAMRFFGMLIAIFIGIQLVFKEIERRTIYSVLSKPVRRAEFVLGKFFGLALTLAVNSGVMVVGLVLAILFLEGFTSATPATIGALLPAAFLIFLELLVITAVALMFSTISSPALAAAMAFLVYVIGNFSGSFRDMAAASESGATTAVLYGLYYVLPNLSNFNRIESAAHGIAVPAGESMQAILYALVYSGVVLSIAVMVFERRDFK